MRKNKGIASLYTAILLACILALCAFLMVGFHYGLTPAHGSDNYIFATLAHQVDLRGLAAIPGSGADGMQYIMILGIALFYYLLGPSTFSSVAFTILTMLGTVLVVFFIGRELGGDRVGLIAAFLVSFMPLFVLDAASGGDNVPMAFFAAFSVLTALWGVRKPWLLVLSGFSGIIGALASVETIIILPVSAAIIGVHILRNLGERRENAIMALAFFIGLALGVSIFFTLGYLTAGQPLYIYNVDHAWYTYATICGTGCPSGLSIANEYMEFLFPYNILNSIAHNLPFPPLVTLNAIISSINNSGMLGFSDYIGIYAYMTVAAAIFLIALKDRRIVLPIFWVLFCFLYLSFGTMNTGRFIPIYPIYQRFTMLFAPAMILILALLVDDLLPSKINFRTIGSSPAAAACVLLAIAMVAALFTISVASIRFVGNVETTALYPLLSAVKFINALPANTTVLRLPTLTVDGYTAYRFHELELDQGCDMITNGSYVLSYANATLEDECGLTVAYPPAVRPAWMSSYPFDNNTEPFYFAHFYGNLTNVTVYYKN